MMMCNAEQKSRRVCASGEGSNENGAYSLYMGRAHGSVRGGQVRWDGLAAASTSWPATISYSTLANQFIWEHLASACLGSLQSEHFIFNLVSSPRLHFIIAILSGLLDPSVFQEVDECDICRSHQWRQIKKADKFGCKSEHVSLWPGIIHVVLEWQARAFSGGGCLALWLIVMQSVGSPIDPP